MVRTTVTAAAAVARAEGLAHDDDRSSPPHAEPGGGGRGSDSRELPQVVGRANLLGVAVCRCGDIAGFGVARRAPEGRRRVASEDEVGDDPRTTSNAAARRRRRRTTTWFIEIVKRGTIRVAARTDGTFDE